MEPIPMILFCPKCGVQHVDEAEPPEWLNPPHATHKCKVCKHLWRPANVFTNGVLHIPMGSSDTQPPIRGRVEDARALPFIPTHRHAEGGMYQVLASDNLMVQIEGRWFNAIRYRDAWDREFVRDAGTFSKRFTAL